MDIRFYGKKHKDPLYRRLQSLEFNSFSNYSYFVFPGEKIASLLKLPFIPPDMSSLEHVFQASRFFYKCENKINIYNDFVKCLAKCETPRSCQKLADFDLKSYNVTAFGNVTTNSLITSFEGKIKSDPDFKALHTMNILLKYKFESCQVHSNLLKSTNNRQIIEFTPYDKYWGMNIKKEGENKLGKLLMTIRDT